MLRRKKKVATSKVKAKPASDIASRIKPVGELKFGVTGCFYGRPGSGKTTLAASFPKPALLVDIGEKGTGSVADVDGLDALLATSWDDLEEVYWLVKEGGHYQTVILDGGSAMTTLAANKVREDSGKKDDDHLSKRDFGSMSRLLTQWITNYRDLQDDGVNVLFLMHERTLELDEVDIEDDEYMPEVAPRMMPSVTSHLCGAVVIVGHCFIRARHEPSEKLGDKGKRKVDYCLRLAPHPVYNAKIRNPRGAPVPAYLVDPTFDKLRAVMDGTYRPQGTGKVAKQKAARRVRKKR